MKPLCLLIGILSATLAHGEDVLTIYTYDSLSSEGGWLAKVLPMFESKAHVRTKLVSVGDSGQIVNRVLMDRRTGRPRPQVLVGIDQNLMSDLASFAKNPPPSVRKELKSMPAFQVCLKSKLIPLNYGYFAWMADTERLPGAKLPASLEDFFVAGYRRKLLVEDPRTSTPGLALAQWYQSEAGGDWAKKLPEFATRWLTLTPGWSQAYGMFLKGEAPIVWSYTTSQAYHRAHGDTKGRYRALQMKEGAMLQVEGAVLLQDSPTAQAFVEFLTSEAAQAQIAETQWMYPVNAKVKLPASFQNLDEPAGAKFDPLTPEQRTQLLRAWRSALRP